MATKTKSGNEPKLSAADLAASIVASKAADDQAREEQRRRDAATYRELVKELAGTPSAARGSESWRNLQLASRIIGERVGFNADNDLRHLDAISHHDQLTAELGDLRAVLQEISDEQRTAEKQHQDLAEKHRKERGELVLYFQDLFAKGNRVNSAVNSAESARAALSHLQGIEG